MKKVMVLLFVCGVIITNSEVSAKETCKKNSNVRVCTETKGGYLYTTTATYTNNKMNKITKYEQRKLRAKDSTIAYLEKKTYNSSAKVSTTLKYTYDVNKKVVRKVTITAYSNGRKKKMIDRTYKNSVASKTITSYYANNKKSNLYSRNTLYHNSAGKGIKRVTNYYNKNYRYNGTEEKVYSASNSSVVTSASKKVYYIGTKRIYSSATSKYNSGKLISMSTNYYTYNKAKYSNNYKKYNTNKKVTHNMNTSYSGGKVTLKKGRTYQSKTNKYHHTHYSKGVKKLDDITTYAKGTIVKNNYKRTYYNSKGLMTTEENYEYNKGEVSKKTVKKGTKTTNTGAIKKNYPVSKGTITSPSWFYPASFGGGWHPGIDVATYSVKSYGRAQPIKVINDATVIKRSNSCRSTGSSGCGGGFGNYVVVATKIDGKYYTILYAHQTKLNSKKASHKTVLNNDKNGYKKNGVIGYVGSSGYSSGYHIHIQVQEHTYAKSINDIKTRYKKYSKNTLFNVAYSALSNNSDIHTINPDVLFNLKYAKSW